MATRQGQQSMISRVQGEGLITAVTELGRAEVISLCGGSNRYTTVSIFKVHRAEHYKELNFSTCQLYLKTLTANSL